MNDVPPPATDSPSLEALDDLDAPAGPSEADPTDKGPALFGKKVFFLNPPTVIDEVLTSLARQEFEVYTVKDHEKLARYLRQDHASLVFVNIDHGDDEQVWRAWIGALRSDPACAGVGIGVVTMNGSDEQRQRYLLELGVDCGYIVLKIGTAKTAEILARTLEANEARGRRKYVRTRCPQDSADFNCRTDGGIVRGRILDLSVVGMAAVFGEGPIPPVKSRLHDLQLSLRGARVITTGIVIGGREDLDGPVRVLLFEPGTLTSEKKDKLHAFIRKAAQSAMDSALLSV